MKVFTPPSRGILFLFQISTAKTGSTLKLHDTTAQSLTSAACSRDGSREPMMPAALLLLSRNWMKMSVSGRSARLMAQEILLVLAIGKLGAQGAGRSNNGRVRSDELERSDG